MTSLQDLYISAQNVAADGYINFFFFCPFSSFFEIFTNLEIFYENKRDF